MLGCKNTASANEKPAWLMRAKSSCIHSLISSQLNTRYIQPHYPLSDNIVSHSVPLATVIMVHHAFKHHGIFLSFLQTKYYDLDKVFCVKEKTNSPLSFLKQYKVIYRNDHQVLDYYSPQAQTTLEYVGENQFVLDKDTFQVKKNYHHVRQMLLFSLEAPHFTLEIEILLDGLDTMANRRHLFMILTKPDMLVNEPAILGSCSFRFIVKDGMVRDELSEHVDTLHEIISSN
jgi:hypothetical protein